MTYFHLTRTGNLNDNNTSALYCPHFTHIHHSSRHSVFYFLSVYPAASAVKAASGRHDNGT